jgi:hypothetical protein
MFGIDEPLSSLRSAVFVSATHHSCEEYSISNVASGEREMNMTVPESLTISCSHSSLWPKSLVVGMSFWKGIPF